MTVETSREAAAAAAAAAPRATDEPQGWDLAGWRPMRALLYWKGFPYVFQAALLLVFLFLAVLGWGRAAPAGVPDKLYAKTNLVNLLIWGVWWPLMVLAAVWLGRVWCAVCPLELVSNGAERLGRRLGLPQRPLGKWLAAGSLIFLFYALIQFLVAGVHLHRVPHYTSIFLLSMLGLTAASGLVWRDRAFCRALCPVGLLLNAYGRGGVLAVRSKAAQPCEACAHHSCRSPDVRYRADARSCPSLLNPARLRVSADCLLCGQCLKACAPEDNMGLFVRRPFHPADRREPLASWPLTLFVVLVSGFVAYELCSEWAAAKTVFLAIPTWAVERFGWSAAEGWVVGVWRLLVFPLALWGILGLLTRALGGAASLTEAWRRLALPLAVVIASGHMAKGLAKLSTWAQYLPMALRHPTGVDAAQAIHSGAASAPAALAPLSLVAVLGGAMISAMTLLALRESRLADGRTHAGRVPAILLVAAAFLFVVCGWAIPS